VVGGPTDIDADIANSFPQPGALFRDAKVPRAYYAWKKDLYDTTGVKLAASYQALFQDSSIGRSDLTLLGAGENDVAAAGWLLLEGKWEAINSGKDWQGGITAAFDYRHGFGSAAEPPFFQLNNGSLWATDTAFVDVGSWLPVLYWEQWAEKDRFVTRVGLQSVTQIYDFFRFKDGRSSFTGSPFTNPVSAMPTPAPGLGASFEWWPVEKSPLYVVGTVNDMNAIPGEWTADDAFRASQFFYGIEVGYNWGKFPTNFDHLHLNVFYADERDATEPVFPNAAGGGFKIAGSKQWDSVVAFGSYTYNEAEGGGLGITVLQHSANIGAAYMNPFGVRGEIAVGGTWGRPTQNFDSGLAVFNDRGDQYGLETYWKLLLLPELWVTPGAQVIFDPSFAPDESVLAIAQIKFRMVF
jgi:carbohydrate-selective porin OprB